MTWDCMKVPAAQLAENKRKHQELLKALIGRTAIGYHMIIDVTGYDLGADTITGIEQNTGKEITVNWKEITFCDQEARREVYGRRR